MERIIDVATKKGLMVEEGTKTLINGKTVKTCIFRRHADDTIVLHFYKADFDSVADDALEAFFDEHVVTAFDADVVRKEKETPQFVIDLMRTGAVIPVAINAEANEELLRDVPHRRVMDLALVYRLIVSTDCDGVKNVLFTNQNMVLAGVTEEELFERALRFARENIRIDDVYNVLEQGHYEFENGEDRNRRGKMLVIRNNTPLFGAGILALWAMEDGITIDLASETPLFVLPSSIHELLVASDGDVSWFASTVRQINYLQVLPEERLSNSVYLYEPETKKVKIAKLGDPLLGRSKEAELEEEFFRDLLA